MVTEEGGREAMRGQNNNHAELEIRGLKPTIHPGVRILSHNKNFTGN